MAEEIGDPEVIAHRPREIRGFTLFHHPGRGWQMSVRRKDEAGWDVKIIPDEQARAILSMLETSGHPDGPWSVKQVEEKLWLYEYEEEWKAAIVENTEVRHGLA
jgi:hypothetical protein